jgi:hypothetical protein
MEDMSSERVEKPTKPTPVARNRHKQRTPEEAERDKELYLAAVAKLGVIMRAVDAVEGLTWAVVQNWRRSDPDFENRVLDARKSFAERLEGEAIRRGAIGYEEPVFYKGRKVATVKKHSDRLLELLLKKHNPEFRDRITADVNVRGGVLVVPGVAPTLDTWAEETGAEVPELPPPDGEEETGDGTNRG